MELERFIELLVYGSDFGNYDSGMNIKEIVPEIHKRIYMVEGDISVGYYQL